MKKTFWSALTILIMTALLLSGCGGNYDSGKDFSRGSASDNTYTSAYSGLTFTLPGEDWQFASEEEMAAMMDVSVDLLNNVGIETSEEEVSAVTIYDMVARDPYSGTNVIILYENLALTQGGLAYDAKHYIEASNEVLQQTGMYDTFSEIGETSINGEVYITQNIKGDISGLASDQYYFVRRIDDYMLTVIISLFGDQYDIDSIMGNFTNANSEA